MICPSLILPAYPPGPEFFSCNKFVITAFFPMAWLRRASVGPLASSTCQWHRYCSILSGGLVRHGPAAEGATVLEAVITLCLIGVLFGGFVSIYPEWPRRPGKRRSGPGCRTSGEHQAFSDAERPQSQEPCGACRERGPDAAGSAPTSRRARSFSKGT